MPGTRRRFLRGLLLAPVAVGCTSRGTNGAAGVAGSSPFTHGPAAADVTARSALVWHRTGGPARVAIEFGTDPGLTAARTTETVAVTADTDYTVAIDMADLRRHPRRAPPAPGTDPRVHGRSDRRLAPVPLRPGRAAGPAAAAVPHLRRAELRSGRGAPRRARAGGRGHGPRRRQHRPLPRGRHRGLVNGPHRRRCHGVR